MRNGSNGTTPVRVVVVANSPDQADCIARNLSLMPSVRAQAADGVDDLITLRNFDPQVILYARDGKTVTADTIGEDLARIGELIPEGRVLIRTKYQMGTDFVETASLTGAGVISDLRDWHKLAEAVHAIFKGEKILDCERDNRRYYFDTGCAPGSNLARRREIL